jgi:23S rRNA (uracil1939-C5)-methyltransferase
MRLPFTVTIEKIVPGGRGLGFHEGRAVFIPLSAPGDQVLVRRFRDRGHYLETESVKILTKSPLRATPPCQYFGDCGGCNFQHLNYEQQLLAKQEILLDVLQRIGKLQVSTSQLSLIASPSVGYRNRLQLKMSNDTGFSWGFFAVGSHRVCPVNDCLIASAELWRFLAFLKPLLEVSPNLRGHLEEMEVFRGDENHYLVDFRLGLTPFALEYLTSELQKLMADWRGPQLTLFLSSVLLGQRVKAWGTGHVWKSASGLKYRVSHGSFFQVNDFLLGQLLDCVTGGYSGKRVLDLYSGVGFFTLALAKGFDEVWAVEKNPSAIEDLQENVIHNQTPNIRIFPQSLDDFLSAHESSVKGVDLIVLDPPRSGLAKNSVARLATAGVRDIVYVSCDPSTLARDIRICVNHGYEVSHLTILDLFPQTHHLETVAKLRKKVDRS